ncbi:MAG: M28 family peptidase, partial [Planctomycetota bacterium]
MRIPRSPFLPLLGPFAFLLLHGALGAADYPPKVKKGVNSILAREIVRHTDILASDAYEGREAGTKGAILAACYIARMFEQYGLEPGGDSGSFFQHFSLQGGASGTGKLGDAVLVEVRLAVRGKNLLLRRFDYEKDYLPFHFSASAYVQGNVVFAGYGISAPEHGYDDYRGLDVKGKIVLVLSHEPQEADPESVFDGTALTKHAEPRVKAALAEKNGAIGLMVVPNPEHHEKDPVHVDGVTAWPPEGGAEPLGIVCLRVSRRVVREVLRLEKKKLDKLQSAIDRSLKPSNVKIKKGTVALRVAAQADTGMARNVVGIYEGSDPVLKEECVVIGAHFDHIGYGNFASRGKRGQIHNGANDNASGTAGVITLARVFTELGIRQKRTLVFAAFDGEEKGLLGSKHYVGRPTVPLDKTVAMLNMDMIGRGPIRKIKVGGGTLNKTLHGILSRISARFRMGLDLKGLDAFLRNSDQAPFMD